jgi:hypothetical protein
VNVGEDTTLGDGDVSEKLVQLLIVADGELEVARDDTGLLVVAGSVASQLEDFSGEILENGGEVDRGTGTDTLSIVALAEETVDTADGERQTSLGRTAAGGLRVSKPRWKNASETRDWSGRTPESGCNETREDDATEALTIARSSSRSPCHRTCRRQSF